MSQLYVVVRCDSVVIAVSIVDKRRWMIGRKQDCELKLPHHHVSRHHALIESRDTDFLITDLDSRNGTWVNGQKITCETRLHENAELVIGPYRLLTWNSITHAIREVCGCDDSTLSSPPSLESSLENHLTPAQKRVYRLLLEGLIEKEVASRLGITVHTVHDHSKAIYKALCITSRGELFAKARNPH